jgi:hypothetical protein
VRAQGVRAQGVWPHVGVGFDLPQHDAADGGVALTTNCTNLPRHDAADGGDVLVVPGVAVGHGGAVADAGDLVAVVPPAARVRVWVRA